MNSVLEVRETGDPAAWLAAAGGPDDAPGDAVLAIEARVRADPDAPAVCEPARRWSYRELWTAVEHLTVRIIASGTSPDQPVALYLPKGPGLIAAMIAVVRSGRCFVALDPDYPPARNRLVLEDADPSLLLHDDAPLPFPARNATFRLPPMDALTLPAQLPAVQVPPVDAESVACLVYTSGSTGRPKGVMVPRGGLGQIARVQASRIGLGPGVRLSMLGSAAVFGGMRTVWGALPAGGSVAPYTIESQGIDDLGNWLRAAGIEVLHCTPAVLRHFARTLPAGERIACVTRLILGADRVLAEDIALARRIFSPQLQVWTGLGASETGTMTGTLVGPDDALPSGVMPLGSPVEGRTILLLDDEGREVAEGQTGEIVVEGRGIAYGYWRQPERTAAAFGPGRAPGTRRYRTGDLARRTPDGALMHMGRRDFVVKVRGVRVDVGEVESVLAQHPEVRECAIVAQPQPDGDVSLVAFVQPVGAGLSPDALRGYIAGLLPSAMVPRLVRLTEDWPKTLSGKLDRRALLERLAMPSPPAANDAPVEPPLDSLEQMIADVWEQVLGTSVADRRAHFLEIGGNSLSAMRVAAQVERRTGQPVAPTALLRAPRLADFAAQLRLSGQDAGPARREVTYAPLREGPLSPAQEALWLINQLGGAGAGYNLSLALRLQGPLDLERLAAALAMLQQRHEALRLGIVPGTPPRQRLVEPEGIAGFRAALEPVLVPDGQQLEARLAEAAAEPIALSQAPLWRVRLFRRSPDDHVLLLTAHHIICDGWSLQLIAAKLGQFYSGRSGEIPAPQGFLAVAAAQRQHAESGALEPSLQYWRGQLEGLQNIELPFDRRPEAGGSRRGGQFRIEMPAALARQLREQAAAAGTTPFVAHIALFQLLLARHAGAAPFGVGIPMAQRTDPRLERTIGYLVGTPVLRSQPASGSSFRQLLASTRDAFVDALEHADVPFERLVRELAPVREPGRNPLFQVAIALQEPQRRQLRFDGLQCATLPTHNGSSKFDLTLEVSDGPQSTWLEFEYPVASFDAETVALLARRYVQLAASAVAAPDEDVSRLALLDAAEAGCLARWNGTSLPVDLSRTLDALVLEQCARSPDAVAIVDAGERITYRELAVRVRRYAAVLREAGLGPEECVGVQVGRGAEGIILALAIQHAGGAYVPLDPEWPEYRVTQVTEAAGIRLILRGSGDLPASTGAATAAVAAPPLRAGALAYVLFTSGSTGTPKGVEVEHASLVNLLAWFRRTTALGPSDTVLSSTSPTFDVSLVEMFAPLTCGACVVVATEADARDPARLLASVREHGVTMMQFVPSACRPLLATGSLSACASVRWLVLVGEVLDAPLAAALRSALPAARIGNFYGPTETTIYATLFEIGPDVPAVIPIGRPLDNTRCHVLDENHQVLPVGTWGDLYIAGIAVARGYRNRPDLTAKVFLPDPAVAASRMYRTGDRARWRADGQLEFAGRVDGQVKLRGLRIELGEIEQALREQRGVAEAVAVVVDPAGLGPSLVAAVQPADDATPDPALLRAALLVRLPRYMVPGRVAVLDSLPRLTSGKLDRPAVARRLAGEVTALAAEPRTERERQLLALWREMLGGRVAGIDDDFFAQGGHSLLAAGLVVRARDTLELPVSLAMLFRHPTVRGLAAALDTHQAERNGAVILPLRESGSRPPVYCICGIHLYQALADGLGPDIPVDGIFLPWEERILDPGPGDLLAPRVETLARAYLDAINAHQPTGAFSLVGVSFGGILAYEIARLARAAGRSVPITVILDMPTVEARRAETGPVRRLLREVRARLSGRIPRLWRAAAPAGDADPGDVRDALYRRALARFRTSPYDGALVVVRASQRAPRSINGDPALGWLAFCGNVRCFVAPGDHLGILASDGVAAIATRLRQWLP